MAVCTIREYEHVAAISNGVLQVGQEPALATQKLSVTGTTQQSAAFSSRTKFIRVHTDVALAIDIGTNPVAVSGEDMVGGQTEYFGVAPAMKIAVKTA